MENEAWIHEVAMLNTVTEARQTFELNDVLVYHQEHTFMSEVVAPLVAHVDSAHARACIMFFNQQVTYV